MELGSPVSPKLAEAQGAAAGGKVGEGSKEEERSKLCIGWRRGGGGGRGCSESDVLPNAGILACRGRSRGAPNNPRVPCREGDGCIRVKDRGVLSALRTHEPQASAVGNNLEPDGGEGCSKTWGRG